MTQPRELKVDIHKIYLAIVGTQTCLQHVRKAVKLAELNGSGSIHDVRKRPHRHVVGCKVQFLSELVLQITTHAQR